MSIRAEHLNHIYGEGTAFEQYALKDVSFEIEDGQFIGLIGHTGSGKSTLVQHLNGLLRPTSGQVLLEGQDMTHTEPNKRDVNTVFQNYALFPHMSVEQNIGYALKIRKRPKAEIREEVKKMLELVQLEGARPPQAFRRAEAAGGHCPVPYQPAENPPAGRAPGRPGFAAAPPDAAGTQAPAEEAGHHLYLHHPRPGGGPEHVRPHRGDAGGPL